MPLFPSADWMLAFCEQVQSHPEVTDLAHALEGVYRFVVEPAGPLDERHSYDVAITPVGDVAEVALLDGDGGERPRLTMTADYRRWQQLVRGELDVGMAVMLRRLRVSGDLTGLVGQVSNAAPLVEALHEVDTVWLEEA